MKRGGDSSCTTHRSAPAQNNVGALPASNGRTAGDSRRPIRLLAATLIGGAARAAASSLADAASAPATTTSATIAVLDLTRGGYLAQGAAAVGSRS